jgi:hypothetical protein
MAAQQVMLSEARTVTSSAAKWNESILDMNGRIMRPGIEAQRLAEGQRRKPATGIVEISTVLGRAEIPVSDETLEDNVAGANIVASIQRLIADQAGFDVEDLFVNGDTGSGDAWLALTNGWLKQATSGGSGAGNDTPNTFVGVELRPGLPGHLQEDGAVHAEAVPAQPQGQRPLLRPGDVGAGVA